MVRCFHWQREGEREMKEWERETVLNIDGALRYRSIRQPSSHNYTSASSCMIHYIETHDYILLALGSKNIYRKRIQRWEQQERIAQSLHTLWAFMYDFNSTVCKLEWQHVWVIPPCVAMSVWLYGCWSTEHVLKRLSEAPWFLRQYGRQFSVYFPSYPITHLFHSSIL